MDNLQRKIFVILAHISTFHDNLLPFLQDSSHHLVSFSCIQLCLQERQQSKYRWLKVFRSCRLFDRLTKYQERKLF